MVSDEKKLRLDKITAALKDNADEFIHLRVQGITLTQLWEDVPEKVRLELIDLIFAETRRDQQDNRDTY